MNDENEEIKEDGKKKAENPEIYAVERKGKKNKFNRRDFLLTAGVGASAVGLIGAGINAARSSDPSEQTAQDSPEQHVHALIEQVLFTAPGERVNRPTFGCGLMQLVFAPNSDALAATSQLLIQGALQQLLGDLIVVDSVQVENDDATLRVTI